MEIGDLKEALGPLDALLFNEDSLSPIFCKPRLIPLKTLTTEKLEKMQAEAAEKMKEMEAETAAKRPMTVQRQQADRIEEEDEDAAPEDPVQNGGNADADIWQADD
ncbi:unnamed protein product, partial [Mesorhabditis spiculigera]